MSKQISESYSPILIENIDCANVKHRRPTRSNSYRKGFALFLLASVLFLVPPASGDIRIDVKKSPESLFQEARRAFDKAGKFQSYLYAPVETKKARFALSQAAHIRTKLGREKNEEKRRNLTEEFRRWSLSSYFKSETALSTVRKIYVDKKTVVAKIKTAQYKVLYKYLLETEELLKKLIEREKETKREVDSFSKKVDSLRAERVKALNVAEDANLREIDAQREKDKMFNSLKKAQRESLLALKIKMQAELEKLAALKEKREAIEKMERALKEREIALKLREEALEKFKQLNLERQKMKAELDLITAKFAKIRHSDRGLVVSLSDILFDIAKADLAAGTRDNLKKLASIINEFPKKRILVEGHTDSTGEPQFNKRLSEERAYSVMSFLISNAVRPDRISAKGFGMEKPIASNKTAEGRQRNRRVDIIILDKPN